MYNYSEPHVSNRANSFVLLKNMSDHYNYTSGDSQNSMDWCDQKDHRFKEDEEYVEKCEKDFFVIEPFKLEKINLYNNPSYIKYYHEHRYSNYSNKDSNDTQNNIKNDIIDLEHNTQKNINNLNDVINNNFSILEYSINKKFEYLNDNIDNGNHSLDNLQKHVLKNDFTLLKHIQFNTKMIADLKFPERWKQNHLIDMQYYIDNFYFLLEKSRSENQYIKFTLKNETIFLFPKYVALCLFDYFKHALNFNQNNCSTFELDDILEYTDCDFQIWMNLLAFNINKYILTDCDLPKDINDLFDFLQINIDFFKKKIKKEELIK